MMVVGTLKYSMVITLVTRRHTATITITLSSGASRIFSQLTFGFPPIVGGACSSSVLQGVSSSRRGDGLKQNGYGSSGDTAVRFSGAAAGFTRTALLLHTKSRSPLTRSWQKPIESTSPSASTPLPARRIFK